MDIRLVISLILSEIYLAVNILTKLKMKFGAFKVNQNTNVGLWFGKDSMKKSLAVSTAFHGKSAPIPKRKNI